jgi:hypothetical protein
VAPGDYHTREQLQALGERVRDKAIQVATEQESAQVVRQIHAEHAGDPSVDATGRIAPDPAITRDMIRSYAQTAYADIPQVFTSFATADPARVQPAVDSLWGVAYALNTNILGGVMRSPLADPIPDRAWQPTVGIQSRIQDIRDPRMKYWAGPAADNFEAKYLQPLADTVPPQSDLAAALALTLTAHRQVREATHGNIWTIGQETLKVLDTLHHTNPHDARIVLDVFVAAVSVLLAVPTDGWSFAGAFGLAKAVEGFGNASAPVTRIIGGKTVNAVISSMMAAVSTLNSGVDQQGQDIVRFLDRIGNQITVSTITPPEPQLLTTLSQQPASALATQFHPRP